MSAWQPIETAPHSSAVLLFGELAGEISGTFDRPYITIGEFAGKGDYPGFDWLCCNTDGYAVWCRPTHWMRLPQVPE